VRALVLSSTFPNANQPTLGVFIRERMRALAGRCERRVVAPVPWFPANGFIRGANVVGLPAVEDGGGFPVYHPSFLSVPRYLKCLDGLLYATSLAPFLVRLRRQFPFDLIDAHFAYPDGVAAVLLGRLLRRPVVITLRGSIVRLQRYRLHRPQIRRALEGAAGIIAVSQSLKDVAVGLGISPERIKVIPNGVDLGKFHPVPRAAARETCGLPADRPVILTVGGIYEGKGQHLVIEALAGLSARYPNALYVMVGGDRRDGYPERLRELAARSGLADRLRFVGSQPHTALAPWYSAADVFCLATQSEGWANVLLEALACGTPVVATRVGGNAEIVREERDGLLVPFGDVPALARGLERALTSRWDPAALIAHAAGHTWQAAANGVMDEFARVAAGVPSAGLPHPRRSRAVSKQ
jgi:teichuronic acid biosynthesis glycosyltransferase TuaC